MTGTLLSIGHGYSAQALADRLLPSGWQIIATTRNPDKAERLRARGLDAVVWPGADLPLDRATHLLTSVSPQPLDPVIERHGAALARARHLRWVGYLSTVGVYGDHQGGWVDEDTPTSAATERAAVRIAAEDAWMRLSQQAGFRLHIFRLAGIYGPGRGPFQKLRSGQAQRIIKPGQYFSRIHRDDIGAALKRAITSRVGTRIFNLCDDTPAPPQDVIADAARMLGQAPPPEVTFEKADLSPMARSFYSDSKRVRNDRIKRELDWAPLYPDHHSGLAAILAAEA